MVNQGTEKPIEKTSQEAPYSQKKLERTWERGKDRVLFNVPESSLGL